MGYFIATKKFGGCYSKKILNIYVQKGAGLFRNTKVQLFDNVIER